MIEMAPHQLRIALAATLALATVSAADSASAVGLEGITLCYEGFGP
jgi:hypothetical protein